MVLANLIGSELLLRALEAAQRDGESVTVAELAADIGLPAMFSSVIGRALQVELREGRVEERDGRFTLTETGRRYTADEHAGAALPDPPRAA